jgi:hypothetical protein
MVEETVKILVDKGSRAMVKWQLWQSHHQLKSLLSIIDLSFKQYLIPVATVMAMILCSLITHESPTHLKITEDQTRREEL